MPQPYSTDLRERVLGACERGEESQQEIARRFGVCPATGSNWRRIARLEGRRAAKPHSGGGRPRLDAPALAALRALVTEDNHATLSEYAGRLAERTRAGEPSGAVPGAQAPEADAQKKTRRATEPDQPEIAAERYREQVAEIGVDRLVFVDESRRASAPTGASRSAPGSGSPSWVRSQVRVSWLP